MKNIISAIILCSMCITSCIPSQAEDTQIICAVDSTYMSVNDEIKDTGTSPFIYGGTTYIPIRTISEDLGADVLYNATKKSITINFNGSDHVFDYAESRNINGSVYIPARSLCDSLGLKLGWYEGILTISNRSMSLDDNEVAKLKNDLKYTPYKDKKINYTITFSKPSGLYSSPFELTLTTQANAEIRYTTDGSEPTKNSQLYSGKINIKDRTPEANTISLIPTTNENFRLPSANVFKGTVIKAKVFASDGEQSKTYVSSYFTAADIFERYKVPVISITTPQENLFDSKTGIYVEPNYTNSGSDWERPAYMELITPDGNCALSQTIGLRINGGFTRKYQQKSLRIYARENAEYQNGVSKSFDYDFFGGAVTDNSGDTISSYKHLILRNSGDDWYNYFIKDAIIHNAAKPLNVDTLGYTPSVVFINGEYWGVHDIRERYDDRYFKSHYNLASANDVAMVEISASRTRADLSEGTEDDLEEFNSQAYFVINNDMTVPKDYQTACNYFDIDNLIDYYCVNIYFENNDWPFNNIKIWKNKNPENEIGGKWRFVISDMDGTFQSLKENVTETGSIGRAALKRWNSDKTGAMGYLIYDEECLLKQLFTSFLENPEFKSKFKSRYEECVNTYFSANVLVPSISKMCQNIAPLRAEHRRRYTNSWNAPSNAALIEYAQTRPAKALDELRNFIN